ncbi:MAG: arylsulfatase A, partial [Kiritimatiellia bacterium]
AHQTIDGLSMTLLFKDASSTLARNALHWHYPHYHHDRPASSIREREWKLIEYLDGTGDVELYNLANDLGETTNLAVEKNGRMVDLKQKLGKWRSQVIARMPIVNPQYNEERAGEWWNLRTGKPVNSDSRKRFPPTEKDL